MPTTRSPNASAKGAFSISAEGTLVYLKGGSAEEASLTWRDRSGKEIEQVGDLDRYDIVSLSPDGKWLAFWSRESGESQVYVAPWPAMAPFTQVSTTTGTWSAWTKGGRELVFQEGTGKLVAVPMTVEAGRMQVGLPAPLFDMLSPVLEGIKWSVTADGEKFLTVNTQQGAVPDYCNLVLNWPDMAKRK